MSERDRVYSYEWAGKSMPTNWLGGKESMLIYPCIVMKGGMHWILNQASTVALSEQGLVIRVERGWSKEAAKTVGLIDDRIYLRESEELKEILYLSYASLRYLRVNNV